MDKDKKERMDRVIKILKQESKDFDNFNKTLETKKEDIQKAYDKVPLLFAELGSFMMHNAKNPVFDLALYFGAIQMLFMVTPTIRKTAKIEGVDVHGKTGTAQNPHGEDHSWFSGYITIDNKPIRGEGA